MDDLRLMYIVSLTNAYKENNKDLLRDIANKFFMLGVKYDNNSNLIEANDATVNAYLLSHINNKEIVIPFVTTPNSKGILSIDNANDWLHSNITIPGTYELQNFFSSDGKMDSRIIIFGVS